MRSETPVTIVKKFLCGLHQHQVQYCHFKSNEHIEEGLKGKTDLDLLIDRSSYTKTINVINDAGFKRLKTAEVIDYPAVEDYLGFDESTGRLIHLHLHWQMIAGEPNLKGFRLPWEQEILKKRVFDKSNDIYLSSPEHELILLLTRAALKLRFRDKIIQFLLNKPYFRGGMMREYDWLKHRIDINKTVGFVSLLFDKNTALLVKGLVEKNTISTREILAFKKTSWPTLKHYRTYGVFRARFLRWQRELSPVRLKLKEKFGGSSSVCRRGPVTGGLVIALLGADGSGKSTHCKNLVRWLGWKVDIKTIYLGSGHGQKSLPRKLMTFAIHNIAQFKNTTSVNNKIKTPKNNAVKSKTRTSSKTIAQQPFHKKLWKSVYALLLAKEKQKKLKKAFRLRNKGIIVITDRYPQNQIMGFNDGPLLNDFEYRSWPWAWFFKHEARMFQKMLSLQPDLVIKLDISAETAGTRKKDTPADMLQRKIESIQQLSFAQQTKITKVDARMSLEAVSIIVKKAVWSMI